MGVFCSDVVMRLLIQRVTEASVTIEGRVHSEIGKGLMVLVGIEEADTQEDIDWHCGKISRLRIFDDENGVMNLDIQQAGGRAIVISQFTLFASTKKGNRPSYIRSAGEAVARPMYEKFLATLSEVLEAEVEHGEFGADMKVSLLNDGPFTVMLDSDEIL